MTSNACPDNSIIGDILNNVKQKIKIIEKSYINIIYYII